MESESASEKGSESGQSKVVRIILTITAGPYEGKTFRLKFNKAPLKVGRSQAKKFKLSLARDSEVSTTHGDFRCQKIGTMSFQDSDSTNGSWLNGEELEPWVPAIIKGGDELRLGQTVMTVDLEYKT